MGHGTCNMELISRVKALLPPPSYTQRRIVCSHYASPPLPFLPHRLAASYRSAPSVTPCPRERAIWMFFGEHKASRHSNRKILFLHCRPSAAGSKYRLAAQHHDGLLACCSDFLPLHPPRLSRYPAAACSMMPPCADPTASSDCAADLVYLM